MTSNNQRETLAVLAELCELSPDVRLGQLLAHLGFLGEDQTGRTLWDIDDDELLDVMKHHRAELADRTTNIPNSPLPAAAEMASDVSDRSSTAGG